MRAFVDAQGQALIPGPTIRARAGDTVHITLHNDLDPDGEPGNDVHNQFAHPNVTNLRKCDAIRVLCNML